MSSRTRLRLEMRANYGEASLFSSVNLAYICISHLGWGVDVTDDIQMVAGTRYIDLVLGGHSHTYFEELRYVKNLDGQNVPVDQNGKHGLWIGKMVVNLAK